MLDRPAIAIVGTRKCTPYGRQMAYQLAAELAPTFTIVSGLAYGIDIAAHEGALDAGGHTIAVLAGGLDRIYPQPHRPLAKRILATGGALISEYPVGTPSEKFRFLERNRIIAGLSDGLIMVESAKHGGSMKTANDALQQNKVVMAVPGYVNAPQSIGPNNLIMAGAHFIRDSTDVYRAMDYEIPAKQTRPVSAKDPDEARLLKLITTGTTTNEALIRETNLSPSQFANLISLMEITGKVRSLGAGHWGVR